MPVATIMERIEEDLNRKTDFEISQEEIIEQLTKLINSGDQESINAEREKILEEMQLAGILDENGEFTDYYNF